MKTTITLLLVAASIATGIITWQAAPGNRFINRCKAAIERQLTSPAGATYGSINRAAPDIRTDLDHRGYTRIHDFQLWLATVDAPNAFGTPLRNYVMCAESPGLGFEAVVTPDLDLLPSQ